MKMLFIHKMGGVVKDLQGASNHLNHGVNTSVLTIATVFLVLQLVDLTTKSIFAVVISFFSIKTLIFFYLQNLL